MNWLGKRFTDLQSQAGESLVEVLIATMLLGMAVVAIVGGVGTTILGSHVHRSQADANTLLTTAAERVKSSAFNFSNVDCTVAPATRIDNYQKQARGTINPTAPVALSLPAGWTSSVITVDSVLFESVDTSSGTVAFGPSCSSLHSRQLVTLRVTSPDGRVTPKLSFVKGDI
jgi:Tfp pilus assembly protein PilV